MCLYFGGIYDFIGKEVILEENVYLSTTRTFIFVVFLYHNSLDREGIWEVMPRIGIEGPRLCSMFPCGTVIINNTA